MAKRSRKDRILDYIQSRILEGRPQDAIGPREFSNGGWTDLKPWDEIYPERGIFVGKNNSVWVFFKTPKNVKTEWLRNSEEIIENQMFFNNVVKELADRLKNSIVKQSRDPRRKFRLSIIRTPFDHLHWDNQEDTPATIDFRKRMSDKIDRAEWEGYFGVELMQSKLSDAGTSLREAGDWFVKGHKSQMSLYLSDLRDVTNIMKDNGFSPLTDMTLDSDDFLNLTAWHGVASDTYNVQRHLSNTRFQEPLHGYSVITPRWGEISFYAIVPSEERSSFGEDPKRERAKWAKPLFNPTNDVVGVWIEGEIRSNKSITNVLNQKRYGKQAAVNQVSHEDYSEQERVMDDLQLLERARESAVDHDALDNTEILVAVQNFAKEKNSLRDHMRAYGMDCRMPVNRQAMCLARTVPCYPNGISKIYKSNFVRGTFSVQMFPGALSMSSILQKTRPNCPNGILLGLSNGDHQYREIFTDIEGASKESATPVMLITGRQGSGKTMQALQMIAQVAYDERPVIFLNPKPDSSFGDFFEHLGGITVEMTSKFLEENPGMLDPFNFFENRENIYEHLQEALFRAMDYSSDTGNIHKTEQQKLSADLNMRVMDKRNKCAADVFFGNISGRADYPKALSIWNEKLLRKHKERGLSEKDFVPEKDGQVSTEGDLFIQDWLSSNNGTSPLPQLNVRNFIKDRVTTSPLWKALIGQTAEGSTLQKMMSQGRPVLIEWDGSLQLPKNSESNLTEQQVDSLISITLAFKYAEEIITRLNRGGMLAVDEAWALKGSSKAREILNSSSREWRERNIMLLMMTQRIADFVTDDADDMSSGVSRYLFMATPPNDKRERELFFRLTGMDDDDDKWNYMTRAGIKNSDGEANAKSIAEGFYLDTIYGFSGGILCGPWPDYELTMARTDHEGKRLKRSMDKNGEINAKLLEDSQYHITDKNFQNLVMADSME